MSGRIQLTPMKLNRVIVGVGAGFLLATSLAAQSVNNIDIGFTAKGLGRTSTKPTEIVVFGGTPAEVNGNPVVFQPFTQWLQTGVIASVELSDAEGNATSIYALPQFADDVNRDGFADMVITFDTLALRSGDAKGLDTWTLTVVTESAGLFTTWTGSADIKLR